MSQDLFNIIFSLGGGPILDDVINVSRTQGRMRLSPNI